MLSISSSFRHGFVGPLLALAFVAGIAACGSDNNSTGPGDVSGDYTLQSVGGNPLPYAFPNSSDNIVVTSATLHLNTDHSYSVSAAGSANGSADDNVIADAGTYSLSGSTVSFSSTTFPGAHYTAAATSTSITANAPGAFVSSSNTSFSFLFSKSN
ncbi:MAG: hypothetical protein H0U66_13390 [Gemmatimonadaceae bacterium]|nr:hypothetical protein [Gemmatimonadaceae bacterium]